MKSTATKPSQVKASGNGKASSGSKGRESFFSKNDAEQSFFSNVQTKLTVGQPGDKYEVEADAMADKVVQRLQQPDADTQTPFFQSFQGNTALQTKCDSCEEDVQAKENDFDGEADVIQSKLSAADATVFGGNLSESNPLNTPAVISLKPNVVPIISKSELGPEEEVQTKEEESAGEETVQLKFAAPDEDVQTKSSFDIQRKGENASAGTSIESQLSNSKGSGSSLPEPTKNQMEASFGADFSNVRVHTDSNAVAMSQSLNAQAFAHGSDVYFNEGKYDTNSSGGQHLLAHELTHTIQQGAAVQKKEQISTTTPRIQRFLDFDLSRLNEYARYIPGWTLFTVLMGYNPLTSQAVERNAINVLDGLMGLVPLGTLIFNKLQEHNIITDAYDWTMDLIHELDLSSESIVRTFEEAWEDMEFARTDLIEFNVGVLTRKFSSLYNRVREFAFRVGDKVFTMIKEVLINTIKSLAAAIPGYTLLTKIIHHDPLTDSPVEATTADIIEEFLLMVGANQELEKMKETGQLEETATWIDEQLAILDFSLDDISLAFVTAWEAFSVRDLLEPMAALERTVRIFAPFAVKVYTFGSNVVSKVFELIKKYLLGLLKEAANVVPGYHLLTVILEKDPFTEEHVPRTSENLIRGFMGLIPGGETQFQQMKESGAIGRLTDWLDAEVQALGLTWEYIKNMFLEIWDMFTIENLMNPEAAFVQVITRFGEPLGRLILFVKKLVMKVIEIILGLMNFPLDLIRNIIANAQSAFEDIKRDPIGFLKNVLRAIKEGFSLFFSNIGAHLLNGVTSWLFGQLGEAGITPPADFSFQSILGLVFQILGVTTDKIMEKIAARIGPERMERLQGMADTAMGVWSFVSDVMERGPVAIWEKIQEKLTSLWDTVLGSIKNWIMTTIIARVTARLLSMLDPTGIMAVINGCMAFYDAINSFIQYLREMLEIVNSFVAGVAEVARGSVNSAAQFLEGALSQAMPVAIGFLANQVGLGGIGRRVGEMITNVQEMVDGALDWLVDKAVTMGESALGALGIGGRQEIAEADEELAPIGEGEDVREVAINELKKKIRSGRYRTFSQLNTAKDTVIRGYADSGLSKLDLSISNESSLDVKITAAASPDMDVTISFDEAFVGLSTEEHSRLTGNFERQGMGTFASLSVNGALIGSKTSGNSGHAEEQILSSGLWGVALERAEQIQGSGGAARVVLAINRTPCHSKCSIKLNTVLKEGKGKELKDSGVSFVLAPTGTYLPTRPLTENEILEENVVTERVLDMLEADQNLAREDRAELMRKRDTPRVAYRQGDYTTLPDLVGLQSVGWELRQLYTKESDIERSENRRDLNQALSTLNQNFKRDFDSELTT